MIGADAFSELAKAAEDAAKNLNTVYLDENHGPLLHAYEQLTDMLKVALEPGTLAAGEAEQLAEETDGTPMSTKELCEQLSQLADCLKTFEADRAEELLKNLPAVSSDGQDLSGMFSEIRSDIDDFEMEAAEQKVQALITRMSDQMETDDPDAIIEEKDGGMR